MVVEATAASAWFWVAPEDTEATAAVAAGWSLPACDVVLGSGPACCCCCAAEVEGDDAAASGLLCAACAAAVGVAGATWAAGVVGGVLCLTLLLVV